MVDSSVREKMSINEARARINYALVDFASYIKVNGFRRKDLAADLGVTKKYVDDLLGDKVRGPQAIEKYQKLMNITGYKGENIYIGK